MTDEIPTTPESQPATASPEHDWAGLVARIQNDEADGMEELYRVFSRGVRFYLYRQLGPQDLDDRIHEAFLIVAQAIRRGELREPERLMGYVRTVLRRQVSAHIEKASLGRKQYAEWDDVADVADGCRDPEQAAIDKQNRELAWETLQSLSERDSEVLVRFYLQQQAPERICTDMGLTETQFRLLKSRAKARFGELGRRRMKRRAARFS